MLVFSSTPRYFSEKTCAVELLRGEAPRRSAAVDLLRGDLQLVGTFFVAEIFDFTTRRLTENFTCEDFSEFYTRRILYAKNLTRGV